MPSGRRAAGLTASGTPARSAVQMVWLLPGWRGGDLSLIFLRSCPSRLPTLRWLAAQGVFSRRLIHGHTIAHGAHGNSFAHAAFDDNWSWKSDHEFVLVGARASWLWRNKFFKYECSGQGWPTRLRESILWGEEGWCFQPPVR